MARIPSLEEILLKINQGLGLDRPQSKHIDQFSDLGMPLAKHQEMSEKILASISVALDMDEQTSRDFRYNIVNWAGFHKSLELQTWTGNASQQQVLWHLLAYSYVPALARSVAFWDLDGMERQQPLDAGMPGGEFWFLPNWDKEKKQLELPLPQVIDWLLNLLEEKSLEKAVHGLEREVHGKSVNSHALRKLQSWRLEGRLPKSAKGIDELFSEDAKLDFLGTFEASKETALAFAQRKGLDAEALRDQIPMSIERLEPVLSGSASEKETLEFDRLIALRYAKPTMRTIRQRLKVARMVQDGYQHLLKFLCAEVDVGCADPARNKLLQLIGLFQTVYNLTIAARKNGESNEEQDAWFESCLAPWDQADLLLSILPSLDGEARYSMLAERLTRKFITLEQDSPLEDLVPVTEVDADATIRCRVLRLKQEYEEDLRLKNLSERIRTASPWRALQAEDSYWVVSQFAYQKGMKPGVRKMAVERMSHLAATPGQTVGAILIELDSLLNCEPKQRPENVRQCVQELLSKAEASPGYGEWKAPLLRFRAKHRLMQNDFLGAREDFLAALRACSERSFGGLRGEIARDGLAAEIAEYGFVPMDQETYYRNMIGYGMFPDGVESFADTAAWCENFFWKELYHPYPGFEQKIGPAIGEYKAVFEETFALIEKGDWSGLKDWMQRNSRKFRNGNFQDARRNSVLLHWLKMLHLFECRLPSFKAVATPEMADGLSAIEQHLKNWRTAIRLLLEAWPEQAKIVDFKGQTPLMLVADNGDVELTRLLEPMSDVDAQDNLGRTALHAAVAGRSPECVATILERNPDVAKVTVGEENTALHTAVRFGVLKNVHLILEEFPGLAQKGNAAAQTPLEMAHEILENLPDWQMFMKSKNRCAGSKDDFEAIIALLESESPKIN